MVALCIEAARKKCEMYWPETEPLECSNGIKVYLLQDQQNLKRVARACSITNSLMNFYSEKLPSQFKRDGMLFEMKT